MSVQGSCLQAIEYLTQSRPSPARKEQVLAFTRAARVSVSLLQRGAKQESIVTSRKSVQELGLNTAEVLQLVNLRPKSEVELYLVSLRPATLAEPYLTPACTAETQAFGR